MRPLYMDAYEPCVFMERSRIPDGAGGSRTTYVEGSGFEAIFSVDSNTLITVAMQETFMGPYLVTVPVGVDLNYPDIIKRLSDGCYYRITSSTNDSKPPSISTIQTARVSADKLKQLPSN